MNITIHRNGENFGPYTLDQVQEYLGNGTLSEDDLAWCEGMSGWLPLKGIVPKINLPPSTPPPPPATVSSSTEKRGGPRPKSFLHRAFFPISTHQDNPPQKVSSIAGDGETNQKKKRKGCIGCLGLFGFILFILILVGGGSHGTSPVRMDGDTLLADANTDYVSNDSLYNHIMSDVWSLAKGNPAARKLTLTVHIKAKDTYGKDMQQDVPIQIDDLDEVRKFADIPTYEYSYHRSEIAGDLMAGGFRGDSQ